MTVAAHVRPDSPLLGEWRARFAAMGATVDATRWDAGALRDTLTRLRPGYVFALLGTTRARAAREGTADPYETVDYGLTRLLLDAVLASPIRPEFVYLSAAGVSATARGSYLRVRWRFEQELRASGLPHLIARPALITGPDREERRLLERGAAALADAALGLAGVLGAARLRERYRSVSGRELGTALARLALDPAVANVTLSGESLRR